MENYLEYHKFVRKVYDSLNGEVNTIIPSLGIVIDYDENSKRIGSSILCVTNIFLENILEKLNYLGLSEEEKRGALIFLVVHELSHNDQDIDMMAMRSQPPDGWYRVLTEAENNVRTLCYIKNNLEKLRTKFGFFIIPEISMSEFREEVNYLIQNGIIRNVSDLRYRQCKSIQDKILSTLSGLFCHNIIKTYMQNSNINSIYLRILNEYKTETKMFYIIVENIFHLGKEELSKLCLILGAALVHLKSTSITFHQNTLHLNLWLAEDHRALLNVMQISE